MRHRGRGAERCPQPPGPTVPAPAGHRAARTWASGCPSRARRRRRRSRFPRPGAWRRPDGSRRQLRGAGAVGGAAPPTGPPPPASRMSLVSDPSRGPGSEHTCPGEEVPGPAHVRSAPRDAAALVPAPPPRAPRALPAAAQPRPGPGGRPQPPCPAALAGSLRVLAVGPNPPCAATHTGAHARVPRRGDGHALLGCQGTSPAPRCTALLQRPWFRMNRKPQTFQTHVGTRYCWHR